MNKEKFIQIRITDAVKKKFKKFTEQQGISMSEYLIDVIKKVTQ